MKLVVFDTETTSLNKPFCYNIGYVIINSENWETLQKRSFVVEQIWHNLPLFSTAYYAEKREIYIKDMKGRKTIMRKFGHICQTMIRDFQHYEVEKAFAYNSSFDEKVFNFNCDWYKCNNPFDNIPISDIRGFVHNFLINDDFIQFCEQNEEFTETGNYSTTAETLFRFITKQEDFNEAHTALEDSIIEGEILRVCAEQGGKLEEDYKTKISIKREVEKELHIQTAEQTDYYFSYRKIRINKDKTKIILE